MSLDDLHLDNFIGKSWSEWSNEFDKYQAEKVKTALPEVVEESNAKQLDKKYMKLFGFTPETEEVYLVCCKNCSRPFKPQVIREHTENCKIEYVSEEETIEIKEKNTKRVIDRPQKTVAKKKQKVEQQRNQSASENSSEDSTEEIEKGDREEKLLNEFQELSTLGMKLFKQLVSQLQENNQIPSALSLIKNCNNQRHLKDSPNSLLEDLFGILSTFVDTCNESETFENGISPSADVKTRKDNAKRFSSLVTLANSSHQQQDNKNIKKVTQLIPEKYTKITNQSSNSSVSHVIDQRMKSINFSNKYPSPRRSQTNHKPVVPFNPLTLVYNPPVSQFASSLVELEAKNSLNRNLRSRMLPKANGVTFMRNQMLPHQSIVIPTNQFISAASTFLYESSVSKLQQPVSCDNMTTQQQHYNLKKQVNYRNIPDSLPQQQQVYKLPSESGSFNKILQANSTRFIPLSQVSFKPAEVVGNSSTSLSCRQPTVLSSQYFIE